MVDYTEADLNHICRVCLQADEDMVDIFGSGMEDQLMEITKLKISLNDKLPKSVCCNCWLEMDHLLKFLEKARSSDNYLRSLIYTHKGNEEQREGKTPKALGAAINKAKQQKSKSKILSRKRKSTKKIKQEPETNKLYLIVVPKFDATSEVEKEICVKDLSVDNGNAELMHYCETLVKNYFVDHTYPKEFNSFNEHESKNENPEINISVNIDKVDQTLIQNVNLFIFKCTECDESFEEYCELSNHLTLLHTSHSPIVKFFYTCPICDFNERNKNQFLLHLEGHKKDNFHFVKVNSLGEPMPVKEDEKQVFTNLRQETDQFNRVFQISLDIFKCGVCLKEIEANDVGNHKQFHMAEESNGNFYTRFTCPICNVFYINCVEKFTEHLISHKHQNNYFIKVNSAGQPVELNENDDIFVPYKEAICIYEHPSIKMIEITNVNSCNKCEYSGGSFALLYEHYQTEHSDFPLTDELICSCPVCGKDFKTEEIDKSQKNLYEHLKIHKNDNLHFIEINKSGTISSLNEDYSSVFTQSQFLYGLLKNTLKVDLDQIWCPDLISSMSKDGATVIRDEGECNERLTNKKELINHLRAHQVKDVKGDNLNYICEKCGKKFSGWLTYKKHFLRHSNGYAGTFGKRPVCPVCNKTFAKKTSLCSHMRNHVEEGVAGTEVENSYLAGIVCEKCGRTFPNYTSLTKHKKVHRMVKENAALNCEICDREFLRQSSYDRHKSAHFNPKYFDCDVCKLPLPSAASLQKHLEAHNTSSSTYDCTACQTSFLTKEALTAHQTHTGHYLDRKPLECNVCHEKFFIGRKFTEHIKTHPKYKIGECTLCGKRLSTVQSLMLHIGRHFESNSILCPHCGKQFFEERNYHRHLLTHEGIKPFACDFEACEKSFYTIFELKRHKKYHSNTRDFGCSYCSKSFHEANHLTVHVRTHTGERPYICPHCSKGFITRTRCKHHIKLVHQGIGYDLIQSSISKKVAVFEAVEGPV